MFQSEIVNELLQKKQPEVKRETSIQEVVSQIEPCDLSKEAESSTSFFDMQEKINKQNKSTRFISRLFYIFGSMPLLVMITITNLIEIELTVDQRGLGFFYAIFGGLLIAVLGKLNSMSIDIRDLDLKIISEYQQNIKSLFSLLSDIPYEVRLEKVAHESKIKVTVEENALMGTNVIKEKSRHITGYLDMKSSKEEVVEFIVALVKKTEATFR